MEYDDDDDDDNKWFTIYAFKILGTTTNYPGA